MSNSKAEAVSAPDDHAVATTQEATGTKAAAPTHAPATSANFTTKTTVSSMSDLKNKAPEVYDAMMMGIMVNIIRDNQDHERRLKEMQREARRNS